MPPLTPLPAAPKEDDYTPLSEHQEQTPGSFFAGKAVLHRHTPSAAVKVSKEEFLAQEELRALVGEPEKLEGDEEGLVSVGEVGVWVGSGDLRLWSSATSKGALIPYPSITVHALLGAAVLLELNLSDAATTPEEDIEHLTLRLLPTTGSGDESTNLYKAIGACQELNPDPMDADSDEEGEGKFDGTAPGATGWITSENMGEFVDEEGNFRMPEGVTVYGEDEEGLGEGAGRVRRAEELDGDAEAEGGAGREEEGKWQRTG